MKDSYSFDIDDAGLDASYQRHRDAYIRIFDKLGFDYVIVKAEAGAMGGSKSEEFLARADVGEDTYVRCTICDYAANVEAVDTPAPAAVPYDDAPAAHAEQTARHTHHRHAGRLPQRGVPPRRPPLGGGRHAQERASSQCVTPTAPRRRWRSGYPATGRSTPKRLESQLGRRRRLRALRRGGLRRTSRPWPRDTSGPASLGEKKDARSPLPPRPARRGGHPLGDRRGRAAAATCSTSWPVATSPPTASSTSPTCATATPARTGDGGTLVSARGIEMGHIFQLGRKYADALGLQVLDENGKLVTVTMGSYGIGPSRAVAAIAENTLDELGLCWPRNVAPADVHVVATGKDERDLRRGRPDRHRAGRRRGHRALRRPRPRSAPA